MKIVAFFQNPYRYLPEGFEEKYPSVVTTPYFSLVDPEKVTEAFHWHVEEVLHAVRMGFDGIAVTEHSQSSYDMAPNPDLVAAIAAFISQVEGYRCAIVVLGRALGKTHEPLKIAEEYAILDHLSGGRLVAGFPVGLSYDASLNNGVPPMEVRGRFYEAFRLVTRAWSEPEPFAWNGRYWQFPFVNIWPRPLQQPRPPVWVPGIGNPETMSWMLTNDAVFAYLSWFGLKLTGQRIFDRFWSIAAEKGVEANPFRVAYLQVVAVGASDADAERRYRPHLEYFFRKGLGAIPPNWLALPGNIDIRGLEAVVRDPSDFGLYLRMREASYRDLVDSQCAVVGGADTVAQQLEEIVRTHRIGNLVVMLQFGSMPLELAQENIERFAREVMPRLRPIWEDEGFIHHWWPAAASMHSARA